MSKLRGKFPAFSLEPEGIIAHDFENLKQAQEYVKELNPKPTHWVMMGMLNDELVRVYEEKDGVVLKNLFEELG